MADTTTNDGKNGAEPKQEITFPVYMIYSGWSLAQMDRHIEQYGGAGLLRIVFGKDDKETNRTIAVLAPETYAALCDDGYGGEERREDRQYGRGFRIISFKLNDNSYPGEGRNKTLFVPVPKVLGDDETWVMDKICDKLVHLSEWGIIPKDSWNLNLPLRSREEGGVKGGCFISFSRDVPLDRIAMTRILLTDTYWPEQAERDEKRAVFRCFWARDRRAANDDGDDVVPAEGAEKKEGKAVPQSPEDVKKVREEKKRRAIQNVAKHARPAGKKAPIVPIAQQPTPVERKIVGDTPKA